MILCWTPRVVFDFLCDVMAVDTPPFQVSERHIVVNGLVMCLHFYLLLL
jgi:hypothetical protein